MDFAKVKENLERRGYAVSCFDTAKDAAAYLDSAMDGETVGLGGSVTLEEIGLYERLAKHNQVFWHWRVADGENAGEVRGRAESANLYVSSANAIAETGEIINIDGTGNRVAATFYGHRKVYIVAGENKIAPDFEAALSRARNVAAPKNANRLGVATPCAKAGELCYDCDSPARICKGLSVFWRALNGSAYEVVLIHENLGY